MIDDLNDRIANIFALADHLKGVSINHRLESNLIRVDKTCSNCGEFYVFWDKDDCDGENELGLHYTCRMHLPGGDYCGSTLVHRTFSKEELKAMLEGKKALRDAKKALKGAK